VPLPVLEAILEHREDNDEGQWKQLKWDSICDGNEINYLHHRNHCEVDVLNLAELKQEVLEEKIEWSVLGRCNLIFHEFVLCFQLL